MTRRLSRPVILAMTVLGLMLVGPSPFGPRSAAAEVAFTFSGSGYGHAVGMSQWGARGQAEAGIAYGDILAWYYPGTLISTSHSVSDEVRVLVAEKSPSVRLTVSSATPIGSAGTASAGSTITVVNSGNTLALSGGVSGSGGSAFTIALGASGPAGVKVSPSNSTIADSYVFGVLRVSADPGGGVRVVLSDMTMNQYLYGLGEMSSSWPMDALKAQAIAARTYAQRAIETRASSGNDWDLKATVSDQSYRGTHFAGPSSYSRWLGAVDSTSRVTITHQGQLIQAFYSASSGGYTETSDWAFVTALPYLRAAADPYDLIAANPHRSWQKSFTATELGSKFGIGSVTRITVLGARASGHMDRTPIQLQGTGGNRTVNGRELRSALGLKSTKFTITGAVIGTPTPPPPSPPPPTNRPVTGKWTVATAEKGMVIVAGTSVDPDGYPLVEVTSTMGRERAVRSQRSTNGAFLFAWTGSPGTRNVCVTLYDTPTNRGLSLGCRNIIVK